MMPRAPFSQREKVADEGGRMRGLGIVSFLDIRNG